MSVILARTWENLRNNWILFLPIIVLGLFVRVMGSMNAELTGLYFISIFLLDRAMKAGLLNQMKNIVLTPERRTNFNDFYEGVARYFWSLAGGSIAFIVMALIILSTTLYIADNIVGEVNSEQVQELWKSYTTQSATPTGVNDYSVQKDYEHTYRWLSIALIGIVLILGLGAIIFLWPQYCVFKNETWLEAWQDSQNIVFRYWTGCVYLGTFWLIPTAMVYLGLMSSSPLIQLMAFVTDLFLKTFFLLMFCQFVLMADPDQFIDQLPKDSYTLSEEASKSLQKDSFTLSDEFKKHLENKPKDED